MRPLTLIHRCLPTPVTPCVTQDLTRHAWDSNKQTNSECLVCEAGKGRQSGWRSCYDRYKLLQQEHSPAQSRSVSETLNKHPCLGTTATTVSTVPVREITIDPTSRLQSQALRWRPACTVCTSGYPRSLARSLPHLAYLPYLYFAAQNSICPFHQKIRKWLASRPLARLSAIVEDATDRLPASLHALPVLSSPSKPKIEMTWAYYIAL